MNVWGPSKRSAISPFLAMDVMAEANLMRADGHDIISLALGQPADPVPISVREVTQIAVADGRVGYTDAKGLAQLRHAISGHYAELYNAKISPEQIIVTTGSSAGFTLAFTAAFDIGQTIAIARPGYPAYRNVISAMWLKTVEIPVNDRAGLITPEALHVAMKDGSIDGLLVASPANPTGTIMARDDFAALLDFCKTHKIRVISDEIYHRLNFTGEDMTALEHDRDVIVINSFSKYYCMTGWRIGWMVVPENLTRATECLQQSLYISAPELSQIAAIQALKESAYYDNIKQKYATNRTLLMGELPKMGITLASPADGAFYAYCDVSKHTNDSLGFSRKMLHETGIAAPSGLDFDPVEGNRTMRFSYAGSTTDIQKAIARLSVWLAAQ